MSPARHLEHVAAQVSRLAADLVRDAMGTASSMGTKSSPTDVVTFTDVESERLIRRELLIRCPGSAIVGEECADELGHNDIGWIVDPIDGTVNFLYDLPVVSVSIAATIDERVVAGAVTDVLRRETFSATLDEGARRDGEPISIAAPTSFDQALVGTGFAYSSALRREQAYVLSRLLPSCRDIRCMGSAALNLCWVGCGRLDGYFERNLKIYDYAAGALVASEGGAAVQLPDAGTSDVTISASPGILDDLLIALAPDW